MRRSLSAVLAVFALLAPVAPAYATVDIAVDLSRQVMRVDSAEGSFAWPISSGRFGYDTPRGSYRIGRLELMHRSRRYDNAPMPNAMFFHGGYAIHGTSSEGALGTPASHGCIRLSRSDAAYLYAMVQREGGRVRITGVSAQDISRRPSRRVADPFADDGIYYGPEVTPAYAAPRRWRRPWWLDDDGEY